MEQKHRLCEVKHLRRLHAYYLETNLCKMTVYVQSELSLLACLLDLNSHGMRYTAEQL
jgi:hypothetical protein